MNGLRYRVRDECTVGGRLDNRLECGGLSNRWAMAWRTADPDRNGWRHRTAQTTHAKLRRSSDRSQHKSANIVVLVTELQQDHKLQPKIARIDEGVKQGERWLNYLPSVERVP